MSHHAPNTPEQPHLVSLVLQSKKALQHGEQLCSRAQAQYNTSAQEAVEVLALDAKVRWIADAITEQFKLAAGVAKCIEEKRAALAKQVKAWDTSRTKYTDSLESILESLGAQVVPPDFHETSAHSSIFGSQHSDDDEGDELFRQPESSKRNGSRNLTLSSPVSPSATLRRYSGVNHEKGKAKAKNIIMEERKKRARADRTKWKTLRDFVDDRAIEDILETIENDRNDLEDTLNQTSDFPDSLNNAIATLRESLPTPPVVPILTQMQNVIVAQDTIIASMAEKLENLAGHYDQMAETLKDSEEGEEFSEEDLQAMNRDTEELPIIMSELDESSQQIETHLNQLTATRKSFQQNLENLIRVLHDLDELGDIMSEMLLTQDEVEIKCEEALTALQQKLETLDVLHERYVLYQSAFNKLVLEMARRRHYKESTDNIVQGMISQLEAMSEEESQLRKHFYTECGPHLPDDICLSIGNEPTRWEVLPVPGDAREVLPQLDADLVIEARERLAGHSDIVVGPESL